MSEENAPEAIGPIFTSMTQEGRARAGEVFTKIMGSYEEQTLETKPAECEPTAE